MLLAMLVAAAVSFAATPLVKTLACKVGAIDVPKDNRRMHKVPIPRMGGLAIFLAFLLSVLVFAEIDRQMQGILLGAIMIVILGVLDDIMALKALPKLFVQIAAAGVAVWHGCRIQFISNPNVFSEATYLNLGWLSIPVTIIWIVAITNAVNFIDGLDGLAVGVSAISTASLIVIALMVKEVNIVIILCALFGACLGFIPYNMNPAKIFMGDTGSTFLGYILATLSITGLFKMYAIISFAVPFLIRHCLNTSKPLVVIPATFLGGGVFCMLCDLIARTAFAPTELNISTVTSIFGAPVVIYMMLRRKGGRK